MFGHSAKYGQGFVHLSACYDVPSLQEEAQNGVGMSNVEPGTPGTGSYKKEFIKHDVALFQRGWYDFSPPSSVRVRCRHHANSFSLGTPKNTRWHQLVLNKQKRQTMKRVFGKKKDVGPAPSLSDAGGRVDERVTKIDEKARIVSSLLRVLRF